MQRCSPETPEPLSEHPPHPAQSWENSGKTCRLATRRATKRLRMGLGVQSTGPAQHAPVLAFTPSVTKTQHLVIGVVAPTCDPSAP